MTLPSPGFFAHSIQAMTFDRQVKKSFLGGIVMAGLQKCSQYVLWVRTMYLLAKPFLGLTAGRIISTHHIRANGPRMWCPALGQDDSMQCSLENPRYFILKLGPKL